MRVGIVTITNGNNYGNRLQNFALQKTLEKLNIEAITIRNNTYHNELKESNIEKILSCKIIVKLYEKFGKKNIKTINEILRDKKFMNFNKNYIRLSEEVINIKEIPKNFEDKFNYFICGSDQIWNPNMKFNSDIDFLRFCKKEKRIAYAPSFGVTKLDKKQEEDYKIKLKDFKALSVRENEGREIIKNLINEEVEVLIDPTMLLKKEEWAEIEKKPKFKTDENYIVTYFLGEDSEFRKKIKSIKEETGLRVINLLDTNNKNEYTIDPAEFIYILNRATLICTDSFHGTVFSILLERNFIVFTRKDCLKNMNSRIKTLLEKFELENRKEENINSKNMFKTDFTHTKEVLIKEREKSLKYLKESLEI